MPWRLRRAGRWLMRTVMRLVGTVLTAGLAVFVAIEISIPRGFGGVVFPNGMPRGDNVPPRAQAAIDEFHLDENVFMRYLHWVGDIARGDFGISRSARSEVTELMVHRLPITLELMLVGLGVMVFIGVPLGLFAAARPNRLSGRIVDLLMGLCQSVPVFITPLFFVWLFAVQLKWQPAASWVRISDSITGNLDHLLLPAVSLALAEVGFVARMIRSDVTEVLQMDYITAAVGKGLGSTYVLFRHALRPASLGLLNVIGLNIGALLSGVIVIERIFGIGGLGQLLLEASINRDLYLILGLTTYMVATYVLLNAIVDALVQVADPRIRRRA